MTEDSLRNQGKRQIFELKIHELVKRKSEFKAKILKLKKKPKAGQE